MTRSKNGTPEPVALFLLEVAAEADHWVRGGKWRERTLRVWATRRKTAWLTLMMSRHGKPEWLEFTWTSSLRKLDGSSTMWARQVVRKMGRALEEM